MPPCFHTSRRVEFHQTDAAGIIHFSSYFQFMEEAEHEFLRHLGLSVLMEDEQGRISWPRVSARCDFKSPVTFEDVVDIAIEIARLGEKSITYAFHMTHQDRPVAHGEMTSVCCRIEEGARPRGIPIPESIVARLQAAGCPPT